MKVLFVDLYTTIRGTVKYVGPVSGLVGYRLGVEVDPDHDHVSFNAGNDGTFTGERYFTCAPDRGRFVKLEEVIECYR
ncbi:tubulin-specific chaperone E-like [Stylophora pistillata]|uniref:tubulin-specific chaperone E-like n=1 Tax=Stylophora pistillata TaxID=50429 RepID=UPI000C04CA1C|nr:tubulin-specific chaperone E-like [Stylophora pistillata]